ncbi:ABC transporter permease subunit [bacterium]|nr:ABC transporter permease subunit [bacterium]
MVYLIARQKFLANIITFRFSASFILSVVLLAASTLILSQDYSERLAEYHDLVQRNEEGLKEVMTFAELRAGVIRPPSVLSVVCEGIAKRTGNYFDVGFDQAPKIGEETGVKNPLLAVFTVFDLATVVEIVLSLLVVFVAYNSISGEREQGTLKLMIASNVPRWSVLLGSYLGGMATVVLPLMAGALVSLLILRLNPSIALAPADYLSLGLVFLLAVLLLGAFYLAGMFISVRVMRSSTALILLLSFWVVTVLILPNCAVYMARELRPVPDRATVDSQVQALDGQWQEDMQQYTRQHPWPVRQIDEGLGRNLSEGEARELNLKMERERSVWTGDWPYAWRVFYSVREVMEWFEAGSIFGHNRRMQYEDQAWDIYRNYLHDLSGQSRLARLLSLASPSRAFYNAGSYLAGTGEAGYLEFIDQSSQYRNVLISYIKDRGGLDSWRLFTQKPMSDFLSAREVAAAVAANGEESMKDIVNYQVHPLDLKDLPRFLFVRPAPMASLLAAWPEIGILVFFNLLFFTLAWTAFLRVDVR